MLVTILLLLASLAIILVAAGLFVNSIEWVGKKLDLGAGVVGSVFAAIATAMPETLIPFIAILFLGGAEAKEIGVGAILGAPFLLTTLAFAEVGVGVWLFSRWFGREPVLRIDHDILRRDLSFFLVVYSVALLAAIVPFGDAQPYLAFLFVGAYAWFVFQALSQSKGHSGEDLQPLHFAPRMPHPGFSLVLLQVAAAFGLLILGARLFIGQVEGLAEILGVSPLLLALIVAPIATELPETFNSVLWLRRGKDTLALSNITGAMVFQSSIPVALGVGFTAWELSTSGLFSAALALLSAATVYAFLVLVKRVPPWVFALGALHYLVFFIFIIWVTGFNGGD